MSDSDFFNLKKQSLPRKYLPSKQWLDQDAARIRFGRALDPSQESLADEYNLPQRINIPPKGFKGSYFLDAVEPSVIDYLNAALATPIAQNYLKEALSSEMKKLFDKDYYLDETMFIVWSIGWSTILSFTLHPDFQKFVNKEVSGKDIDGQLPLDILKKGLKLDIKITFKKDIWSISKAEVLISKSF